MRAGVVAGRIQFFSGNFVEGLRCFRRARTLAGELGDASLIAHALGHHLESLLRYEGLESVVGELGSYRKAALRAGTPDSLGVLHRILAEAELKSGRGARALHELDLCEIHVEASSDSIQRTQLALARSAAYGSLGDIKAAHDNARSAVALAEECGALSLERSAKLNLANCQHLLGLYDQALTTYSDLRGHEWASIDRELDFRGNELLLAVARNDLDAAASIDAQYWTAAKARDSVSARGYRLARIGYLIKTGRAQEAVDIGSQLLDVPLTADRNFVARVQCLTSEALGMLGQHQSAFRLIASVLLSSFAEIPEFYASATLAGGVLASRNASVATELYARSARVFSAVAHFQGEARARKSIEAIPSSAVPPSNEKTELERDATGRAIRGSAALADLASHPALALFELADLLRDSGAAIAAAARRTKDGKLEDSPVLGARWNLPLSDDAVVFGLGADTNGALELWVRPSDRAEALPTLLGLKRIVENGALARAQARKQSEAAGLWPELAPEQQLGFICASESMLQLLAITRRLGSSMVPVLITGETGCGKEMLARALHFSSPRAAKRLLPFNCTAVPKDMLDSQLFGYRRGAFTGAQDAFPGIIRSAAGGTLFLDEIGEISPEVQPKLLRFLESNEVHPLGEPAPVPVDVRVVAATNANLEDLVAAGKFREDLFYRLNVVKLTIPPLRERREEIPLLLDHFLERSQRESNKTGVRFSDIAIEYLLLYNWPGNVRELANEVRRAVALAEPGAVLMPEHLSPRIATSRRTIPSGERAPTPSELIVRRDQPLSAAIEHVERAMIQDALRRHANVEDAARALGLSRKGLYLKRQRLKIDESFLAS